MKYLLQRFSLLCILSTCASFIPSYSYAAAEYDYDEVCQHEPAGSLEELIMRQKDLIDEYVADLSEEEFAEYVQQAQIIVAVMERVLTQKITELLSCGEIKESIEKTIAACHHIRRIKEILAKNGIHALIIPSAVAFNI